MRTIHIATKNPFVKFECPICGAKSICDIRHMTINQGGVRNDTFMLVCRACNSGSVWKQYNRVDNYNYYLRLVDPLRSDAPPPSPVMPADVRKDYLEASMVSCWSPRAAAALLRLALQKLCRYLGEPGDHLDTDIRSMAKKPEFNERLIRAADTLRITGNNAVHPGEMSEDDIDNVTALEADKNGIYILDLPDRGKYTILFATTSTLATVPVLGKIFEAAMTPSQIEIQIIRFFDYSILIYVMIILMIFLMIITLVYAYWKKKKRKKGTEIGG